MRTLGSIAAVAAAVRDDVQAESERLERDVAQQLARLAQEEAADVVTVPEREPRLAAARREARGRLAREEWQGAREALEERERWIERVVVAGQRTLAEPEELGQRRAWLARLARDGLERLPGDRFEVVVAAADAAILDAAWCREVASSDACQVRVVATEPTPRGGCVVRTADGKVAFDNSIEARSQRFQSAWRSALGELYES